jgi:hypothetical protein
LNKRSDFDESEAWESNHDTEEDKF